MLLAEQKLMKLVRNNIHIQWNEISQTNRNRLDTLFHSCHRNKKGGIKKNLIPFIKLHETLQEYPPQCVAAFGGGGGGLNKFKMAAVAMVTKVLKMLNSNRTADPFETCHKNRSSLKVVLFVFKIFKMATVAMETAKMLKN